MAIYGMYLIIILSKTVCLQIELGLTCNTSLNEILNQTTVLVPNDGMLSIRIVWMSPFVVVKDI